MKKNVYLVGAILLVSLLVSMGGMVRADNSTFYCDHLLHEYDFENGSGTTLLDGTGRTNLTFSTANLNWNSTNVKVGSYKITAYGNGPTDGGTASDLSFSPSMNFTVMLWVRSDLDDYMRAMGYGNADSNGLNDGWSVALRKSTDDGFWFQMTAGGSTVANVDSGAQNWHDSLWHHITLTYRSDDHTFYTWVDGVGNGTAVDDNFSINYSLSHLYIAGYNTYSEKMTGDIDQLIILNGSVGQSEVDWIYNGGNGTTLSCGGGSTPLYHPPSFTNLANNNSAPYQNDTINFSVTISSDDNVSAWWAEYNATDGAWHNSTIQYLASGISSVVAGITLTTNLSSGEMGALRFWANNTYGNTTVSAFSTFTVTEPPNLGGLWHDDAESGTPADNGWSGGSYVTTYAHGGSYSYQPPDDGNDYYNDQSSVVSGLNYSVTFWYYDEGDSTISGYRPIGVTDSTSNAPWINGHGVGFGLREQNDNTGYACWDGAGDIDDCGSRGSYGWRNITFMIYTNNTVYFYLDGSLIYTAQTDYHPTGILDVRDSSSSGNIYADDMIIENISSNETTPPPPPPPAWSIEDVSFNNTPFYYDDTSFFCIVKVNDSEGDTLSLNVSILNGSTLLKEEYFPSITSSVIKNVSYNRSSYWGIGDNITCNATLTNTTTSSNTIFTVSVVRSQWNFVYNYQNFSYVAEGSIIYNGSGCQNWYGDGSSTLYYFFDENCSGTPHNESQAVVSDSALDAPIVEVFNHTYYLVYNMNNDNFTMWNSTNGINWTKMGTIYYEGNHTALNNPDILREYLSNGSVRWHLYFEPKDSGTFSIYHATMVNDGDSPFGSYTDATPNEVLAGMSGNMEGGVINNEYVYLYFGGGNTYHAGDDYWANILGYSTNFSGFETELDIDKNDSNTYMAAHITDVSLTKTDIPGKCTVGIIRGNQAYNNFMWQRGCPETITLYNKWKADHTIDCSPPSVGEWHVPSGCSITMQQVLDHLSKGDVVCEDCTIS